MSWRSSRVTLRGLRKHCHSMSSFASASAVQTCTTWSARVLKTESTMNVKSVPIESRILISLTMSSPVR